MGFLDIFRRKNAEVQAAKVQAVAKPDHIADVSKMIEPAQPSLLDNLKLKYTVQGSRIEPDMPDDEPAEPVEAIKPAIPKTLISQPQPFRVVSPKGLAIIKEFEGLRLKAYRCPAKKWTIGYGWTIGVKPGMVWTREKAEQMLVEGVKPYAAAVAKAIGKTPTTQGEFDALVSFCYNAGPERMRTSSMLRHHLRGQKKLAADAFMKWTKGGGRVLPGLVRRRRAEKRLYEST